MLIFVKMRSRPEKADALMDDVDDERANIMAYHHEGGGEEDQVNKAKKRVSFVKSRKRI